MSTYRLDRLFSPRSVVVVGGSPRATSPGRAVLKNLRSAGFKGSIGLVNPRYDEIEGVRSVRTIDALPQAPDLLVIAAPAPSVPGIVAAAGQMGAATAIIITAGLGHGAGSLADACEKAARATGLRFVGPNCLGVLAPRAKLNASFAARMPPAGDLALISQSGAIAAGLVEWSAAHGIGFSAVVSLGDKIDVDFGDLLDFFALDRAHPRDPALRRIDRQCAQVHVGGARRRADQTGGRGQVRPPCAGREGRADPHRCARRCRRGLRRCVPPRRPVAGARSRRAVRRGRDARTRAAVFRQAPGHPHQWRRHRRACGRSAGRSRRHSRRHLTGDDEQARCRIAADLVAREPGRHRRRCRWRPLRRRVRGAARRPGERCHPGHERADRADLGARRAAGGRRGRASASQPIDPAEAGVCGVGRQQRCGDADLRSRPHSQLRDRDPTRSAALCTSCATGKRSKP